VPITYKEESPTFEPEHLEGGTSIDDDSSGYAGTLTLVCYDADTGAERAVTADHVMDGASTMYNSGTAVADFDNRDTATDTTAYDVRSGASTGPLETYPSRTFLARGGSQGSRTRSESHLTGTPCRTETRSTWSYTGRRPAPSRMSVTTRSGTTARSITKRT